MDAGSASGHNERRVNRARKRCRFAGVLSASLHESSWVGNRDRFILSRLWTLTTTYTYSPNTGEMTGIDYSDDTPDVAFTYDRLGRRKTITDAVGSREFVYSNVLQVDKEKINESAGGLYGKTITRDYETTRTAAARPLRAATRAFRLTASMP